MSPTLFALALAAGPVPVAPQHAGVGKLVPILTATTLSGEAFPLAGGRPTVVAVTSTSCPVSRKYVPELARLAKAHPGFDWVFVNPLASDEKADMAKAAAKLGGRYVSDSTGTLAAALGATSTADVFVLDARRTVAYRGAVDDRYGPGFSKETATRTYLADALTAVAAGKPVPVPATTAPGCDLALPPAPAGAVTYHDQIARIVQRHCLECHRAGGVGPFPLETRDQLLSHKGMVRRVVEDGTMPPWFAKGGHWANDRSLTAADKAALAGWLAAGGPAGDPADAPAPAQFPAGEWAIGRPDAVYQIAKPVAVKADGVMPYHVAEVDTGLTEDRWVQGFEVRPTAPAVVHHVLVFALSPAEGKSRLERAVAGAEERRGFFAAYVPGNAWQVFPDGFAKKLVKGSRLRFQIHYTPNGTAAEDQVRVGVKWAKGPPAHELKVTGLANPRLRIPAGAAAHPEEASIRLPFDAVVTAFMPHLHVRGVACKYEATAADGKATTLLDIPRYDFNWQLRYQPAEPVRLARGTTLKFTAVYDNSAGNPANPDPTRVVPWGQQTTDEMLLGYVEYYVPK